MPAWKEARKAGHGQQPCNGHQRGGETAVHAELDAAPATDRQPATPQHSVASHVCGIGRRQETCLVGSTGSQPALHIWLQWRQRRAPMLCPGTRDEACPTSSLITRGCSGHGIGTSLFYRGRWSGRG